MTFLQQLFIGAVLSFVVLRIVRAVWTKAPLHNVPGPKPTSYLRGNVDQLLGHDRGKYKDVFAQQYGRLYKVYGPMMSNWIYTFDPRAMHSIFIKDTDTFGPTQSVLLGNLLTLGPGLLSTKGHQHLRQRKMLNPLFSAKHLREMTPIFNAVVGRLHDAIASRVKSGAEEIDVLSWMGRAALELIGQGGLGHSFDPLTRDVADDFADSLKSYFPAMCNIDVFLPIFPFVAGLGTPWFRRKVVEMVPYGPIRKLVRITDTMHENATRIYNQKKALLESGDEDLKQQVGEGKDIMSVLLRANMEASEGDRLPSEEVVAQISTMVFAAMDTTSNALARTLELLSEHPDVQETLRLEILHARDDGSGKLKALDYDEVMSLPYLDAVCRETLRVSPPVPIALREVLKDGTLPLSAPIRGLDGSSMESIPVTKGMWIIVDIKWSNRNKELWGEDADEWKPERWLKPLPAALEDARIPGVYSHLMSFIGGGRSCIGFKFSQLEMKIVLATLLATLKFEPSGKTIVWNPAGIAFPSVGKPWGAPELPLKITML
ncbi:cytochrome P450 [Trametes polyzona]|nr:cytochrome P450 [Trametes polyzona]